MQLARPLLLLHVALGSACSDDGPTAPRIGEADLRVLFVGNSLTATNDLPALVAGLARDDGRSFAAGVVTLPNSSLEDHVASGVLDQIRRERPDVVVMQQGPSSLPESRVHLVQWSGLIAQVTGESGGRPALLMVWPPRDRLAAFDDVRDSYAAAAAAVGGLFMPAGEAWRAAWRRNADLGLYGADGFHPAYLGTLLAAMTVYGVLYLDTEPFRCPGPQEVNVDPGTLSVLCDAVEEALDGLAAAPRPGAWSRPPGP